MFKFLKRARIGLTLCALAAITLTISDHGIRRASAQFADQNSEKARTIDSQPIRTGAYFERNKGQFDSKVDFFVRGTAGYSLFLTGTDAVYVIDDPDNAKPTAEPDASEPKKSKSNDRHRATAVYMSLVEANRDAIATGLQPLEHKTNYFKGGPENWRTEIPNFREVQFADVYPGIDSVWRGNATGAVQYDFIVRSNADPNQIALSISGAESAEIDDQGNLVIKTEFGDIRQQKPFTFQETDGLRQEIESRFVLGRDTKGKLTVRFQVGDYDRTKTLIIDPSINYSNLLASTFLGGSSADFASSVATDSRGNIYVTGGTSGVGFPTTPGTFDRSHNGIRDVFVSKLNYGGTNLVYSTFIGGPNDEFAEEIKVDNLGNVFLAGNAESGFPTTVSAYDGTYNGSGDAFISKLGPTGSTLVYSTYLGGSNNDRSFGLAIDASGNAYISGTTLSTDFPTTPGAFDTSHNGSDDAIVTKLNSGGSGLVYSTFIGGSATEYSYAINVDGSGTAVITGQTNSPDYPTTPDAYDGTVFGTDAFLTEINASGSAMTYSTSLGGSSIDSAFDVAVDQAGDFYLVGETESGDFPTNAAAFDTSPNGANDAFITKLNRSTGIVYSTYLGGGANDRAYNVEVDSAGRAYVVGYAVVALAPFPTTSGSFDASHNGLTDAFFVILSFSGINLNYSTFIGGQGGTREEEAYGLALDSAGNAIVCGYTGSTGFPTSSSAVQPQLAGLTDGFVAQFGDFSISGRAIDYSGNPIPNVAVQMSGTQSGFILTDAQGYFSFGDTPSTGTIWVSAVSPVYNFTPNIYQIEQPLTDNYILQFVGRPATTGPTAAFGPLGGEITSTAGNIGLPFTNLTMIDTFGNVRRTTTDANGNYHFNDVPMGASYFVFAEREGYSFSPASQFVDLMEPNLNINFTARPTAPRPKRDFDGDGKADLAVFRPSDGNWYIQQSQNNTMRVVRFGLAGDVPLAADFDGDERTDIAVFRPSDGNWYRLNSSDGGFSAVRFGLVGDNPLPADFDGDRKADLAVWRPSTGVWHRLNSSTGAYVADQWGLSGDTPLAEDFDSDGKADLTVFRNGTWYRRNSSDGGFSSRQFGVAGDRPIAADFDGDGRPDIAVFRPDDGTWHWLDSVDGEYRLVQFGISSDVPVPADFNGDGRDDHAIFRNGAWWQLFSNGSTVSRQFGTANDLPVFGVR